MPTVLTADELAALQAINSPTISNAIELFNVRPPNQGFMSPDIKCIFPDLGVMIGYAVTMKIATDQPVARGRQPSQSEADYWKGLLGDYWKSILSVPEPRVVVVQDLDNPPGTGSIWGEVNANIHKTLGGVGVVTNGSVRDLDQMHGVPFFAFASAACVSHAYAHIEDFGSPVKVGGVVIKPGDFIHADKHGVLVIPDECLKNVAEVARNVDRIEREFINYCQSPECHLAGMVEGVGILVQKMEDLAKKWAARKG